VPLLLRSLNVILAVELAAPTRTARSAGLGVAPCRADPFSPLTAASTAKRPVEGSVTWNENVPVELAM